MIQLRSWHVAAIALTLGTEWITLHEVSALVLVAFAVHPLLGDGVSGLVVFPVVLLSMLLAKSVIGKGDATDFIAWMPRLER